MSAPLKFKRMVFDITRGTPDESAMHLAAEFAEHLGLDLLGFFVEEFDVPALAGMPFARELRSLEGGWAPIDAARLASEAEFAAGRAERRFQEAVERIGARASFELFRGGSPKAIASLSRSSDIVVIGASRERARSMLESPAPLAEEALRCKLSVLFLPNRVVRRKGPIVVLASDPEEESLGAGLSLAMALKSELIVVATGEAPPSGWEIAGAGGTAGAGIRLIHAPLLSQMLVARLAVLEHLHEGLLVLPGGGQEFSFAASLAAERRVPVLIVQGTGAAE